MFGLEECYLSAVLSEPKGVKHIQGLYVEVFQLECSDTLKNTPENENKHQPIPDTSTRTRSKPGIVTVHRAINKKKGEETTPT